MVFLLWLMLLTSLMITLQTYLKYQGYFISCKVVLFRRAATMVMAASTLRELALNHRLFIEINLLVAMRRF